MKTNKTVPQCDRKWFRYFQDDPRIRFSLKLTLLHNAVVTVKSVHRSQFVTLFFGTPIVYILFKVY